jgi:lysophospholipase L1-like esterase
VRGYTIVNKGIAGEQTHQMLARFERDVVAAAPQAVLIWGHINNIHRAPGGDVAAVRPRVQADYESMIARARARGIEVILATEITLTEAYGFRNKLAAWVGNLRGKEGYNARVNREVRALNDWLRNHARQHGIRLLDFERALDDGHGFRKEKYTSEDGSHVNDEGYAALSAYLVSGLGA